MNIEEKFFLNGFIEYNLKSNIKLDTLIDELHKINTGEINHGFEMKQKYNYTQDLTPNIYEYSPIFFDILLDNSILELLNNITQRKNFCYNLQLRKTFPSRKSYMTNHRDSYIRNNKIIGNIPPPIKIIFYPRLRNQKENKLSVNSGSHIKFFRNYYFDRFINFFGKKSIIESSNSTILIFNTMLYHSIFPEKTIDGSLRLIYSFGDENILKNYQHNQDLIERFKQKFYSN